MCALSFYRSLLDINDLWHYNNIIVRLFLSFVIIQERGKIMIKANKKELDRIAKAKDIKDKIVRAATDIMNKYGYKYVTVRNVCEEAGITTGKFYRQFDNKDMLLIYLTRNGFDLYKEENEERLKTMSCIEQLINLYHWYVTYFTKFGIEFTSNYFTANNQFLKNRRSPDADYLEGNPQRSLAYITYQLVLNAQKEGSIKADADPQLIYRELDIVTYGAIFEWCLCGGDFDIGASVISLIKMILNSYK